MLLAQREIYPRVIDGEASLVRNDPVARRRIVSLVLVELLIRK